MTPPEAISFARRLNPNSSIDSICVRCYQTIATSRCEDDLAVPERTHVCDPNSEFTRAYIDSRESASGGKRQWVSRPATR
jgi:hypothetical protein